LHRNEIDRLYGLTQIKGHTIIALRMYWKDARVKIELGVGKGKESVDKRADLKERATKRETDREVSRFNRKYS
jgi:SsrA-binding protein